MSIFGVKGETNEKYHFIYSSSERVKLSASNLTKMAASYPNG